MGIFIKIMVDEARLDSDIKRKLVALCPVDIFAMDGEHLTINGEQEDECTLCGLCLKAAPLSTIRILKTYSGEILESGGELE